MLGAGQTPNKAQLPGFWVAPPGLSAVTPVTFWPGRGGPRLVGPGEARGRRRACSWRPRQVPGAVRTSPGTCDPTTRARPAGGAWGGDAVFAAPSGTGTEASARNSVCPEPRFTSSCDRITGAAEPFARKGPREPGGLRAPGRREGTEERVQSGLSPEGHGPWGLTGPGPDLPRPRGLRVPGTSWILRTWIMGTRVFCNLFSQENFPASPGRRRHGLLRRWRALLSGKLDGGGTRAS